MMAPKDAQSTSDRPIDTSSEPAFPESVQTRLDDEGAPELPGAKPERDPAQAPAQTEVASTPRLARSAGLLAMGNVASRVLGLVREMVIAALFGASGAVSAFRVAAQVPNLVYDFLIGGMLSAALVPVLSRTASGEADESRDPAIPQGTPQEELRVLVRTLIGIFGLALMALTMLLVVAAPWITRLFAGGFAETDPSLLLLTTRMVRLMAPAVWFFSMAGLLTAVLYALQRFSIPALGAALFNLGIIVVMPLLASRMGILAAAGGVLAGSLLQCAVMAWDVRRAGLSLRPRLDWNHPALRRVMALYLPIAAGLIVMLLQVTIDRRLASGTGESSIAWMAAATTLQQMPLGLISVALSLAALPTLSRHFAAQNESAFVATLGRGLRLVLLLLLPAAVGLALLAEPAVRLLFERGEFRPTDTQAVVQALHVYLVGMLFAGIDFPLNYASYARNNTRVPALVGVASVLVYLIVAFSLLQPLGYLGLVWADTAKQAAHALIMLGFMAWVLRVRHTHKTLHTLARPTLAAGAMAAVVAAISTLLQPHIPQNTIGDLLLLVCAGAPGLLTYGWLLRMLGVEEAILVWRRFAPQRIIRSDMS